MAPTRTAALLAAVAVIPLAGCGEKDESTATTSADSEPAAQFPAPAGRTIQQLSSDYTADDNLVIAPSGAVFTPGQNRFGFGVFQLNHAQVADADVALYAAPASGGPAKGPYTARVESLETEPKYTAQTTAGDPDAAKDVYVTRIDFDRAGEWRLIALARGDDGKLTSATLAGPVIVKANDAIPDVGEQAPVIHTPTVEDVGGNVSEIDTRQPPDDMHDVDFADVVGKQPVVLLFATPALCQSRVCGPVVDVAEQVKNERPDDAAYIHMEIYAHNQPPALRPQVKAYHLQTEPWLFVIDRQGRVSTRIEGAFSADELNAALDKVSG